jgi:hypothetical protein
MATFTDGTPVPEDGKYHIDPANPIVKIRYLEPWYPPGNDRARLGLLPDGSLLISSSHTFELLRSQALGDHRFLLFIRVDLMHPDSFSSATHRGIV